MLLPIVLLTTSSGWRGIHIASGTRKAAHLWHTWPLLRIDSVSGLAKGRLTGVQHTSEEAMLLAYAAPHWRQSEVGRENHADGREAFS